MAVERSGFSGWCLRGFLFLLAFGWLGWEATKAGFPTAIVSIYSAPPALMFLIGLMVPLAPRQRLFWTLAIVASAWAGAMFCQMAFVAWATTHGYVGEIPTRPSGGLVLTILGLVAVGIEALLFRAAASRGELLDAVAEPVPVCKRWPTLVGALGLFLLGMAGGLPLASTHYSRFLEPFALIKCDCGGHGGPEGIWEEVDCPGRIWIFTGDGLAFRYWMRDPEDPLLPGFGSPRVYRYYDDQFGLHFLPLGNALARPFTCKPKSSRANGDSILLMEYPSEGHQLKLRPIRRFEDDRKAQRAGKPK